MSSKTKKSKPKSATVRVAPDALPHQPKMDKSDEVEQLTRNLFTSSVRTWCKGNLDETPHKEVLASVVDNLTASFTSTIETLVEAATDSYLSTIADEEDDEEGEEEGEEGDEDEEEDEEEDEDD